MTNGLSKTYQTLIEWNEIVIELTSFHFRKWEPMNYTVLESAWYEWQPSQIKNHSSNFSDACITYYSHTFSDL